MKTAKRRNITQIYNSELKHLIKSDYEIEVSSVKVNNVLKPLYKEEDIRVASELRYDVDYKISLDEAEKEFNKKLPENTLLHDIKKRYFSASDYNGEALLITEVRIKRLETDRECFLRTISELGKPYLQDNTINYPAHVLEFELNDRLLTMKYKNKVFLFDVKVQDIIKLFNKVENKIDFFRAVIFQNNKQILLRENKPLEKGYIKNIIEGIFKGFEDLDSVTETDISDALNKRNINLIHYNTTDEKEENSVKINWNKHMIIENNGARFSVYINGTAFADYSYGKWISNSCYNIDDVYVNSIMEWSY